MRNILKPFVKFPKRILTIEFLRSIFEINIQNFDIVAERSISVLQNATFTMN